MLKNITRQLQALLSRHLPHRLIARDPLPNANTMAGAAIPASLTERCLNVAAMDENEVWRAFGGHPEGLNAQEVSKIRAEHGDNQIPAQKPSPWWVHLWLCYRNPFNLLLTVLGIISYATEDLFAGRRDCPDGGDLHAAELYSGIALHQSGGRPESDGQQHRHRVARD